MLLLTPYQNRIWRLMATGISDREIGELMGVKMGTIRANIKKIRQKLGTETRLKTVVLWYYPELA
ncbi:CsgD DNA-binding HTH domain-containing proteins [uncultured Caudovirales phage]|uniref:CsgD DNA-binding HTH domain-containing proteins n=1 Tax=uncultured Caudovirales phage TaxID=2100421 RepID=A0A6J5M3A2_9CAUD|nr:CsgD DNA-binding HTH domain-containing proteins [uncultured Caudovirales phage]